MERSLYVFDREVPPTAPAHPGPSGQWGLQAGSAQTLVLYVNFPHPSPSETPAGLSLPHSHSRAFPASLARSLTGLHQTPASPPKAVAEPCPPLLLPGRGPGRDSRRSHSECGRTFWSYSCRTAPIAAGSQEAIGQRLILQSPCGSV